MESNRKNDDLPNNLPEDLEVSAEVTDFEAPMTLTASFPARIPLFNKQLQKELKDECLAARYLDKRMVFVYNKLTPFVYEGGE